MLAYALIADNDPSAGSPTETLLRLLLPLNDKVCVSSRGISPANRNRCHSPKNSPDHSIGRSDGRCVQRAGTYSVHVDDIHLLGIPGLHVKISKRDPK